MMISVCMLKENGELNFQDSYLLADYPQVVDNRDVYPRQVRELELDRASL